MLNIGMQSLDFSVMMPKEREENTIFEVFIKILGDIVIFLSCFDLNM